MEVLQLICMLILKLFFCLHCGNMLLMISIVYVLSTPFIQLHLFNSIYSTPFIQVNLFNFIYYAISVESIPFIC